MRTGNTSSKKGDERKAGAGLLPEPSTDNGTTQRLDRDRPKRAGPSILVIYTLYINCIVVVSEIPMRAGDSRHVPLDRARSILYIFEISRLLPGRGWSRRGSGLCIVPETA